VVEPAGAAATAYLLDRVGGEPMEGPIVSVLSGGNIDPLLMLRIIRHGMTVAGRYLQFSVVVPDSPGNLAALLTDCAETDANVLDVEHVRTSHEITVDQVEIALVLETKGPEHQEKVLQALRAKGYDVRGPASQPV